MSIRYEENSGVGGIFENESLQSCQTETKGKTKFCQQQAGTAQSVAASQVKFRPDFVSFKLTAG